MRQSGATLQQIAEHFDISRQRVSRLLVKYYGSTDIQDLVTIRELAQMVSSTRRYINKLRHWGAITPAMVIGHGRTLWEPKTAVTVISYLDSLTCPVCDTPLSSNRQAYCSHNCYLEAHKYKNEPAYARRQHRQSVTNWLASHPEQARWIEKRKQRKYRDKKLAKK